MPTIQPIVKSNIGKTNSASLITKFFTKIIANTQKHGKNAIMPVVAVPLVYYNTGSDKAKRTLNKIAEIQKTKKDVTETEDKNLKALKTLGIPEHQRAQYLDDKGHINNKNITDQLKEKKIPFKGGDESSYVSANLDEGDFIVPQLEIYDNTATLEASESLKEIESLDKAIEGVDKLLDNPALLIGGAAIAAEVVPVARFIKPFIDLWNGDLGKAGAGAVSRTIDLALAPVKLFFASSKALCDGVLGLLMDDKDLGFVKGFKEFYTDWAKGRDEIEDEFLGRETKSKKLKKLEELKIKLIEERDNKIATQKKMVAEQQKLAVERQHELTLIQAEQRLKEQELIKQNDLITLGRGDLYLGLKRESFEQLLAEYKRIKPSADLSKFANYTKWNSKKLSVNANMIEREIRSIVRRQDGNSSKKDNYSLVDTYANQVDASLTQNYRKEFEALLNEYQSLKPSASIAQYNGWWNWHHKRLKANVDHLKRTIETIKRKASQL